MSFALTPVTPSALEGEILDPEDGAEVVIQGRPFGARAVRRLTAPAGSTISEIVDLAGFGPNLRRHLQVSIGPNEIPYALWGRVRPKPGAAVHIRPIIAGGLGRAAKNVLRYVLLAIIVIVAVVLAVYGQYYAAGALLSIGTSLINTFIRPPPRRRLDDDGNPYTVATQNALSQRGPIPRLFGRRRVTPQHASRPYSEPQGRNQYLRLLLLVGYGPIRISDIRIGNTPITSFEEVEIQIREGFESDADQTLFTRSVQEESLSVRLLANQRNVRATDANTREASIDITFPFGLFERGRRGDLGPRTIDVRVEYSANPNGPWTLVNWIEGQAEFGTSVNGRLQARGATDEPDRRSGRFALPSSGLWYVSLTRITAAETGNTSIVDDAFWEILRSITTDRPVNMKGIALIAMRIRATGQLSGNLPPISCLAEAYLPVHTGTNWQFQITRNPAWAYIDVLRRRGLNTVIADDRIDIERFRQWAALCDTPAANADEPRFTYDALHTGGSIFETLRLISPYGRAQFALREGKYSVFVDAPQTVPVQHITPRNSWNYQGFKAFPTLPDAIRVRFLDASNQDAEDEVFVYRDGFTEQNAKDFSTLDLPGAASSTFAWREGRYHLAQMLLRPEDHSVTMDVDGLACELGDLVMLQHDVISVGLGSGRIVGHVLNPSGLVAALDIDASFAMEETKNYAIRVRRSDGKSQVLPLANTPGFGLSSLTLAQPLAPQQAPQIDNLVMFGEAGLESAPMLVKSISPGPNLTTVLTFSDAQPGVHDSDSASIPAHNSFITRPRNPAFLAPSAPALSLRSDGNAAHRLGDGTLVERIIASISPPPPSDVLAAKWEVEWKRSDAARNAWAQVAVPSVETLSVSLTPAQVGATYDVRARFVSSSGIVGPWAEILGHEVLGYTEPPPDVTGFAATPWAEVVWLSWGAVEDPTLAHYRIRRGPAWVDGVDVGAFSGVSAIVGLDTQATFWIKAINRLGVESVNAASVLATPDASGLVTLLEPSFPSTEALGALAEQVLGEALRTQELRAYLDRLGYLDGLPVGTVVREVRETSETAVEDLSLLGARSADGAAFVLAADVVRVSPNETLAQRFVVLEAETSAALARVTEESSARASAIAAEASTRSAAVAQINTSIGAVLTVANASATEVSAVASEVSSVVAQVSGVSAAVQAESSARASAIAAEASTRSVAVAQLQGSIAVVSNTANAAASAANASASQTNILAARVDGAEAGLGALAAVVDDLTVEAGQGAAVATRLTAVEASVGSLNASVSTITSAQAAQGGASALLGFRLDVNGVIGGAYFLNNGQETTATFDFDVLQARNIRADNIVAGSITTENLSGNAVTNLTDAAGGQTGVISQAAQVTLLSEGVVCSGGRMMIDVYVEYENSSGDAGVLTRVFRNGVLLDTFNSLVLSLVPNSYSYSLVDMAPPEGGCTYTVTAQQSNTNRAGVRARRTKARFLEAKR